MLSRFQINDTVVCNTVIRSYENVKEILMDANYSIIKQYNTQYITPLR